ncbi:MAG: DEAD/DEAH box helicase [Myxococcota bacterium]|nr:DEAD/DEAH box helicase [Myxococcota bacterium]
MSQLVLTGITGIEPVSNALGTIEITGLRRTGIKPDLRLIPVSIPVEESPTIPLVSPVSLTGKENIDTASLGPPGSSAAPQLRSQRTEPGGGRPAGPELRPYQIAAVAAVERELTTTQRTLLVLPTGTGKTVVFAELAAREVNAGGRVLVLAHREELLDQARKKLEATGVRGELEQGKNRASTQAPVVIASVQTLRGKRLERYPAHAFSLVVVDEAHHAAAASYRSILDRFATAKILGVTATPDRGDGKALGKIFESVAFTYDMRQAIREEFLAPLRARRILVKDLDLSAIRSHHGDFDQGELAAVFTGEKALHGVVSPLLELAGDRRTLVFGVDVAHAHALAEVLNRYKPASAIAVDGSAKPEERAAALALFRRGTFQFLVNCALFTEGFDEPSIACVAMARPTQSRALYTQMLGRGTRPLGVTMDESRRNGKVDCLVLDFVGNSKHRLIGPADALGGLLDDVTREVVEKQLGEGEQELEAILELAAEEAAHRRSATQLLAIAVYRQKNVDPFLGDHMPPLDPNSPAGRQPATEKQLAAIEKAGCGTPPPGITLGEASQVLDGIAERRRLGLATIPQARLLERLGLDTKGMTFARATALIVKAKSRGPAGFKPFNFIHEPEARRNGRRS